MGVAITSESGSFHLQTGGVLGKHPRQSFNGQGRQTAFTECSNLKTERQRPDPTNTRYNGVPTSTGSDKFEQILTATRVKQARRKRKDFEQMYTHILLLTPEKILAKWQYAVNSWNEREEKAFWSRVAVPSSDEYQISLMYHVHFFDLVFFDGQLARWITVEWDDNIKAFGDCRTGGYGDGAHIRIKPVKLSNGGLDYNEILNTLLHETLHALRCLEMLADYESPHNRIHRLGFSGHGPMFREMGAIIQGLANKLLFHKKQADPSAPYVAYGSETPIAWNLDVCAYGTSHKLELWTIGQIDPSSLGGWQNFDFNRIQGKRFHLMPSPKDESNLLGVLEPPDATSTPEDTLIYNVLYQWCRRGYLVWPEVQSVDEPASVNEQH
ncbi:MAG: hypothetical protein Q9209_005595 [Squamulea sp. 1 TL-2023]